MRGGDHLILPISVAKGYLALPSFPTGMDDGRISNVLRFPFPLPILANLAEEIE